MLDPFGGGACLAGLEGVLSMKMHAAAAVCCFLLVGSPEGAWAKERAEVFGDICPKILSPHDGTELHPYDHVTIRRMNRTRPEADYKNLVPEERREGTRVVRTWMLDWTGDVRHGAICNYKRTLQQEAGDVPEGAQYCRQIDDGLDEDAPARFFCVRPTPGVRQPQ